MADPAHPRDQKREPIEDQVLVALRRIIRSIDIHSRVLVKYYGLTGPQMVVLQEIAKHHEITPGRLAKVISLSQAAVSGILERLKKRGLITRRRSESDRRRVLIKSTLEADRMLNTRPPVMQLSFIQALKGLQEWEQTMILSSLQRLANLMNAEALESNPILSTDTNNAPTANSLIGSSLRSRMEKANGKDRH